MTVLLVLPAPQNNKEVAFSLIPGAHKTNYTHLKPISPLLIALCQVQTIQQVYTLGSRSQQTFAGLIIIIIYFFGEPIHRACPFCVSGTHSAQTGQDKTGTCHL